MFRPYHFLRFSLVFLIGCCLSYPGILYADKKDEQRQLFSKIERSLKAGRRTHFIAKRNQIKDYALYPYLQFYEYKSRLKSIKEGEIISFLNKYGLVPVVSRLRQEWLAVLAKRGDWAVFVRHYQASSLYPSKKLACQYGKALIRTDQREQAEAVLKALWLVKYSQPPQCDSIFNWGFKHHLISDDWVWQRLLLVIDKNLGLARYLGERLSSDNRRWYRQLLAARKKPLTVAQGIVRKNISSSKFARDIAVYAVKRQARRDLDKAIKLWGRLDKAYTQPEHKYVLQHELGLIAAKNMHLDFAYNSLSQIPSEHHTSESRQWLIRVAMRAQRWDRVMQSLPLLNTEETAEPRWQYWRARALWETNQRDEAIAIWRELAQHPGYFSYLAADQINESYKLQTSPITIPQQPLGNSDSQSAIARMGELIKLKRFVDARREFFIASDYFGMDDFLQLAVLAEQWAWSDGAIRAIAKSGFSGDTQVRFPMPYRTVVKREAAHYRAIPEEWVYGVIRRESAFMDKAKSPVGALGLMQLMPRTARQMISRLKLKRSSSAHILRPSVNVKLGVAYLNRLYRQYGGRLPYMLAAYNAGGTAVARWRKRKPTSDATVWIETIPFKETRNYVPAVLYYITVYTHRLGKTPQKLKTLMQLQ